MSNAYRAVLFDFFGTLTQAVRRGPAHDRIARQLGCPPRAFTRALDETFLQRSTGALGDAATALGIVARMAGGRPSRYTLDRMLTDRVNAISADTRLRPEAAQVLELLRRFGLMTAVISDCGPELPVMMPALSIAPHIDTCVFSVEIGARKPDAIMYLTACERLGVRPSECLYVGDGGSRELSGASAVGMSAVRLDAPDLGDHLAFDVDEGWRGPRIDSLTDVFDALPATGGYVDAGGGVSACGCGVCGSGLCGSGVCGSGAAVTGGRTNGAVNASGSGRDTPPGPDFSPAIFACSCRIPCSSASGRGGQPGTYTSTGISWSTPLVTE
jgi:putative hydrolase of the HAD superfamily